MSWAAGLPVTDESDNPIPVNPNPADVINLSFAGIGPCDPAIQDIIDQIRARGVVLVAAAGNDGSPDMSSVLPANCTGVIAVAATTRGGDRAGYSNYGAEIEISAPGGESFGIWTTDNSGDSTAEDDRYWPVNGTSMAAAQVSAAVALMRAVDGDVSPATVTSLLINSAQPFPAGSTCATSLCGAGILDLDAALQQVAQSGSAAVDSGGGGCVLAGQGRHDLGLTLLLVLLLLAGRLAGRRASNP